MGILHDIMEKAEEFLGGGQQAGLLKAVIEMLQDKQTGGLNGLIESFQQKGLGDIISSWIGTGQNMPISPEQVKDGLGNVRLEQVASLAGMSTDDVAAKLSEHLPDWVNKLTPEGKVDGEMLDQGLEMLKSKLLH